MPSFKKQQVVGGGTPNTTPPVVQAPGRQTTVNRLPQLGGFRGLLKGIRPPIGSSTPKVAATNTSTVGGGSGPVQTVGGGSPTQSVPPSGTQQVVGGKGFISDLAPPVTKPPTGPTSDLAPPVTQPPMVAPTTAPVFTDYLKRLRKQVPIPGLAPTSFSSRPRSAPSASPRNTISSRSSPRNTISSRSSPRNTISSRSSPRDTSRTRTPDPFGTALARRRRGGIVSDNPKELRSTIAAIRSSF